MTGVMADFNNIVWREVFQSHSPIESLNRVLLDIHERRIPAKIIRSHRQDNAWFNDDSKRAQREKQVAYCEWSRLRSPETWEHYVCLYSIAQLTYSSAQNECNEH